MRRVQRLNFLVPPSRNPFSRLVKSNLLYGPQERYAPTVFGKISTEKSAIIGLFIMDYHEKLEILAIPAGL